MVSPPKYDHDHVTIVCSCGVVITTCKCHYLEPRPIRTIKNGCIVCKTIGKGNKHDT